jgi:hypothetical protein
VLHCGHMGDRDEALWLRASGAGFPSRFERPRLSRRHNCYGLGRLFYGAAEMEERWSL